MNLPADKFYQARIKRRVNFTEDLWMIRVDPGGQYHFTAGQFATLGVMTPEKLVERPYSIASSPQEDELEFFIELVPQGEMTPLLHKLHAGDSLVMRRSARGRFVLDVKSGRPNHLLLSTVTGVAPSVSIARTLFRDWKDGTFRGEHKIFILEGASRSSELGYHGELRQYDAETPWLTYVSTVSRPWEDPPWLGETGRVDDLIRKYTDLWELNGKNTTVYLCGHPTMIENGKGILQRGGWDKGAIREEAYFNLVRERAE